MIELPPHGVTGLPVQLLRIVQQVEGGPDQRRAGLELRPFGCEFGLYPRALLGNSREPGADLCAHGVAALHQIEEVLFLGVKVAEGFGEVRMQEPGTALFVAERGFEDVSYAGHDIWRKAERGVVTQDGRLGVFHPDVTGVALVVLAAGAHEVPVLPAPTVGSHEDEA